MFPGAKIGPAVHARAPGVDVAPRPLSMSRLSTGLVLSFALFQCLAGCESNKNYDQRDAFAASLPPGEQHAGIFADDPPGCLGLCQRDPGSPLVDCEAAEKGLDLDVLLWNFDNLTAPSLYTYTDRSVHNLDPYGWEPRTEPIVRCIGAENERGFHLRGGPFRDWGGGFGMRLDWKLKSNCTDPDPEFRAEYCAPLGTEPPFDEFTFDLTHWDGVSFWARRGPDGQPLLRVMIGDRRTDDDISFLMYEKDPEAPRFCERNRECGCPADLPCLPVPAEFIDVLRDRDAVGDCPLDPLTVCWDPETDPQMTKFQSYELCGDISCNCPYEAFPDLDSAVRNDPQFYGRSCNSFGFRGGIVDDYCYDPGEDPDPYESNYLCGDHWTKPVHLTTDWQFYKVPFTSMLQQGWAKEQHEFDLNAVSMIRFSWDKGNIDYYIDDVAFYREQRPLDGAAGAESQ